jgi:protein O-GlcNAc transferase
LLATEPGMEARLRDEALRRGIPATRLIFAPRVPYEEHLARLSHADLYLDTLPFNGGASTSDALWAGVPVVTCAGEAFAARMSGSLLSAVGLPELITNSLDGYTDMVRDLATDVNRLAQYKARLLRQRGNTALFDAQRFCRHLELAYQGMWERSQRGQPPASFAVEPLPVGASAGIAP